MKKSILLTLITVAAIVSNVSASSHFDRASQSLNNTYSQNRGLLSDNIRAGSPVLNKMSQKQELLDIEKKYKQKLDNVKSQLKQLKR